VNVVQLVKDGKGRFDWAEVLSEHNGYKLHLSVLRDAMRFDGIPAMTWDYKPAYVNVDGKTVEDDRMFDGVRLPATAHELQEIADLVGGMLMTPRVIDLIWLQAKIKFDAALNTPYPSAKNPTIFATSHIHHAHEAIEKKIADAGGDDGYGLISCVGKYWCVYEQLAQKGMIQGDWTACNYGWFTKVASGPGLTPGTQCWQRPGFQHNKQHWDPSQTIRLMYRQALLVHPDGTDEGVDLHDVAGNPDLCGLLTANGKPLTYLRQKYVEELEPLPTHGIITLPEITITGKGPVA